MRASSVAELHVWGFFPLSAESSIGFVLAWRTIDWLTDEPETSIEGNNLQSEAIEPNEGEDSNIVDENEVVE